MSDAIKITLAAALDHNDALTLMHAAGVTPPSIPAGANTATLTFCLATGEYALAINQSGFAREASDPAPVNGLSVIYITSPRTLTPAQAEFALNNALNIALGDSPEGATLAAVKASEHAAPAAGTMGFLVDGVRFDVSRVTGRVVKAGHESAAFVVVRDDTLIRLDLAEYAGFHEYDFASLPKQIAYETLARIVRDDESESGERRIDPAPTARGTHAALRVLDLFAAGDGLTARRVMARVRTYCADEGLAEAAESYAAGLAALDNLTPERRQALADEARW